MMKRAMPRGWAVFASLAVHGIVLALVALVQGQGVVPRGQPPRLATFSSRETAQETMPQPGPEPAPARQQAAVGLYSAPSTLPSPAPSAIAAVDDAPLPQSSASPTSPSAPVQGAAQTVAAARTDLHQAAYVRLLWQAINAHRPSGQDFAGRVLVVFSLDSHGHLRSAGIGQTSGQILLDHAALKALRLAAPFPAPPVNENGGDLTFTVEVLFRN